jgi:O-antigen/teichoic acid export membrane protein
VLGALGNSASPRLAGYYARGQSRAFVTLFLKLQVIAALAGFAGIMVAWLAGRPLLTIVFRPEYAAYSDVLVWLMVAAALIYLTSFFGHALTACHYFKYQAILLAMTATLTALACAMLVPAYGLRGAAWAMGGVSLAHLCGLVFPMLHAVRAMNAGSHVAPDDAAR